MVKPTVTRRMSSRLPPNSDPANQAVYIWSRIDPRRNRLIRDKLRRATLTIRKEIDREARRIRFENRLNSNKKGVDERILGMWARKIQAHAEMCYEKIFCHHWILLGHRKTGAFVRASSAMLGRYIDQLGNTEAQKARMAHRRRGGLGQSLEGLYKRSGRSIRTHLEEEWDIEARELDLAASIARTQENTASASPLPERRQNRPMVTSPLNQAGVLQPGDEMVVECGPLSARETDTTAPAIELLRKLGFYKEEQKWPSSSFGPVLPYVLAQLKRAHQILSTRGFVFVGDPLNPLGDGKSWILKCEPPIDLPNESDPTRLAHRCLQNEGISVATRPVLDGDTLLIPLWDSGNESATKVDRTNSSPRRLHPNKVNQRDNERLGERMGEWDRELRRIAKAARAKRQYNEEDARIAFPDFTLWKAIDDSNVTMLRRRELFGPACQTVGSRDGRFELIGELTAMSPYTAYDIYKLRPSRKRRSRKKRL
jgi:hypothetical protein